MLFVFVFCKLDSVWESVCNFWSTHDLRTYIVWRSDRLSATTIGWYDNRKDRPTLLSILTLIFCINYTEYYRITHKILVSPSSCLYNLMSLCSWTMTTNNFPFREPIEHHKQGSLIPLKSHPVTLKADFSPAWMTALTEDRVSLPNSRLVSDAPEPVASDSTSDSICLPVSLCLFICLLLFYTSLFLWFSSTLVKISRKE